MLKQFFLAASLLFSTVAVAQNPAATSDSKDRSETAEMLNVAGKLVKYGYQTKTAMPLIQAAEIYNRLGVSNETEAKAKASESDAVTAAASQEKASSISFDSAKLLADATEFADGDKNLLALIKGVGSTRGRVPGPIRHYDRVNAQNTDVYNIRFRGGESALVIVTGDGDTDLDLFVYDENGNFITSDTDAGDDCVVSFNPRWTGNFKIKVKNYGRGYNNYVLITN